MTLLLVAGFYNPGEFVLSLLKGGEETGAKEMAAQFTEILGKSSLTGIDNDNLKAAADWEQLCEKLFRSYQAIAIDEIGRAPLVGSILQ